MPPCVGGAMDKLEDAREKVRKRQLHGPLFSDDVD